MVKRRRTKRTQSYRKPQMFTVRREDAVGARRVILAVVILVLLTVAIGLLVAYFYDEPEAVRKKIEEMATEYYEDFIFEETAKRKADQWEITKTLAEYSERGLAPVRLRQLLLYDGYKNASERDFILKHCDENETEVLFHPVEPYQRESYWVEYQYKCDF